MRVTTKKNVFMPSGGMAEAGKTVDVPDDVGKDWIKRGLATEAGAPPTPPKPYTVKK